MPSPKRRTVANLGHRIAEEPKTEGHVDAHQAWLSPSFSSLEIFIQCLEGTEEE